MKKRIFCILMALLLILSLFNGCTLDSQSNLSQNESNGETTQSNVNDNYFDDSSVNDSTNESDATTSNESQETNKDEEETSSNNTTSNNTSSNNSSVGTSSNTSSRPHQNSSSNSTSSTRPSQNTSSSSSNSRPSHNTSSDGSSSTNTSSSNTSSGSGIVLRPTVDPTANYPKLTEDYIYPSDSYVNFKANSSNIYENKYAKVDATTASDGYILVTYKDPWAESIDVVLDEWAVHADMYVDSHITHLEKGCFGPNTPIAIQLPKTDAIYYIVVVSVIDDVDWNKMFVSLGELVVDGDVSYKDMVPSEEQIKLTQTSSGIYTNKYVKINTNTASKGYIEIDYIEPNAYDIRISVTAKGITNEKGKACCWHYYPDLTGKCKIKVALTYGNAEYVVTVNSTMKNSSSGLARMSKKAELTVKLNNVSNTGAFLISTGEVIYDSNTKFVKKAAELTKNCKNDFEKVAKIYDWLTDYLGYGNDGEYTAVTLYKCDLDKIYNRGYGVCYDFAVAFAAMLRSQGIACKVVFGEYADRAGGHAYNEIYISGSGSITTDKLSIKGNKWCILDPTLSEACTGQETIDYMNNPDNYLWRCYY